MFKHIFFTFLDITGILLGIFLTWLAVWLIAGFGVPAWAEWVALVFGVGALLIHTGHYFDLPYMRWVFGDDYFVHDRSR